MLGIEKILMLNQFFYSARLNQKKISKNSKDFDSFVSFISKEKFKSIEDDTIKGPILNEYTRGIELYVGKYKVNLS